MGQIAFIAGYIENSIPLWVTTGVYLVWIEPRRVGHGGKTRIQNAARIAGWINLTIGLAILVARWVV